MLVAFNDLNLSESIKGAELELEAQSNPAYRKVFLRKPAQELKAEISAYKHLLENLGGKYND